MVRTGRRFCGAGQGHWDAETRKSRTNIEGLSEQGRRELFAYRARREQKRRPGRRPGKRRAVA